MQTFILKTRFALVAAVSLALFVGGLVSGSAGASLIVGRENSAGSSTTALASNTRDAVLLVRQEGEGTALRGSADVGIAGFFTSANGSGVSGVVANENGFGVYAANDSTKSGSGAGIRANADENPAIVASSGGSAALVLSVPDDEPPFVVNSSVRVTDLHADGVDGWSIGCPARTVLSGGLCFETAVRDAASVFEAADECHALEVEGGAWQFRLATALQLRTTRSDPGVSLDADGEHSDSLFGDEGRLGTLIVFPDGRVEQASAEDAFSYRCVTTPLSEDWSLNSD